MNTAPISLKTTVVCDWCKDELPVTGEATVTKVGPDQFEVNFIMGDRSKKLIEEHNDQHSCRWCGQLFERRKNESRAAYKRRKHCSRSCVVSHQNHQRAKDNRLARRLAALMN